MKKFFGLCAASVINYIRSIDRLLVILCLAASIWSLVLLTGIYYNGYIGSSVVFTQAAAIGLGILGAFIVSKFDYTTLMRLWKLYVPVCFAFVVFTSFFGVMRGDNMAWLAINIGRFSFSFQPSELLKICFILTLAVHLEKVQEQMNTLKNMCLLCLHGGAYVLAVHLQGDDGTALIFLAIFLIMIFVAGVSWKYVVSAVLGLIVALPAWWLLIAKPDQKLRILILFNPDLDDAISYQQAQGEISIGSGMVWGKGIFTGNHRYVPELYNDFLFSFIGEAMGFIGCLAVLILLCWISCKVLVNTRISTTPGGKYICVGVFAMIVSQMIINLGMCLRLLPVIGVTLPFFSQGGTSVVSMYLAVGLVLSVYSHSRKSLFSSS